MSQSVNTFEVDFEVYRVADELPDVEDESWYEYRVKLYKYNFLENRQLIDDWDSIGLYNPISGGLTKERAEEAAKEVKKDVEENGEADAWFDTN